MGSMLVPLAIPIFTLPRVLSVLGAERYGILSLVMVVVGYFNLFDFGLAGATTKFVAEALGHGKEGELPSIVWTAVLSQVALGLIGAIALIVLTSSAGGSRCPRRCSRKPARR
jgi:O-antigen/teichoic acid export membrane protein